MTSQTRRPWTRLQHHSSPHTRFPLQWPDSIAANLVIVGAMGFGYVLLVLGLAPLNPRNLSWLWGDLAQHYIAWELFRQDPRLHWPLTFTDRVGYPLGDSIAFMDPNPLLSILLKPLSPLLPTSFQYLGISAVLAVSLQFLIATRLFRLLLGRNLFGVLLPSLFFVMAPPLTARLAGHYALANHWLLVAALCLFVSLQKPVGDKNRKLVLFCGLLGGLAVGVHPYLALMVVVVVSAGVITAWWRHRLRWKTAGAIFAAIGMACLLVTLALGLIRSGGGYAASGYREYAMDLLAPIDPVYSSLFLRPLSSGAAWEGYNYLGAGMLMLAIMVLPSLSRRRLRRLTPPAVVPLAVACLALTALAVSTKVTAGSVLIADVDPHETLTKYLAVFRASGRLFWVPYYVILTAVLASAFTLWRPKKAAILVSMALLVQFADTIPLRQAVRSFVGASQPLPLESPLWSSLGQEHANLLVFPPWQCGADTPGGHDGYRIFGLLAASQRMRTNSYYAARYSVASLAFHCEEAVQDLRYKPLAPDSVYVLSPAVVWNILAAGPTGTSACHTLDGFIVCSTKTDFGLGPGLSSVPFMYPSGRIESFREAANSGYFIGNWHDAAPDGIWSKGYGIVQFRLSPEQRSRYDAVSLQLAVPVGRQGVRYHIQSGSQEQSGAFLGSAVPRIEVFEVRVLLQEPPGGIERIVLTTQDAVRPVDIGLNSDGRLIGLGAQGMTLVP
jgi:Family of unknown function (DUF6311)